ncbi:MAG: hypothetical protein AAGD43_17485 [Pseudomonadota bacterium]
MIELFSYRWDIWWTWLLTILTAALFCFIGTNQGYSADPAKLAGPFQKAKFAAVVQSIRKRNLKSDRLHRFRLDRHFSPSSLKRLEGRLRRGAGRGVVWAEVSTSGALQVAIETRDFGRRGEVGYMYSDVQLTISDTVELGREWTVLRQVANNWWMIVYRLG